MKFWLGFIGYCLMFLVMGWGFNLISTEVHEQVHVAIFSHYGVSSTVNMNWWTGKGSTSPNPEEYSLYCNDYCKMVSSLNEVISYNVNALIFAMMVTVFILGLIVMMVINYKKLEQEIIYQEISDDEENEYEGGDEPFAELSDLTGEEQ